MEKYLLLIIAVFILFRISRIYAQEHVAILVFGIFSPRISFGSTFHIPILEKYKSIDLGLSALSVCSRGHESLRCKDCIKVEIECTFYYQIRRDPAFIMSFFDENDGYSPIKPNDIYESTCREKIKEVVAGFDFEDLFTEQVNFRDRVLESVAEQFPEIEIVDVASDFIEQLPLSEMNPDDELDRKGIQKIESLLAKQKALETRQ